MGLVREMRGMRAIAQGQELVFQNYFFFWEFDFISMAHIGMSWTRCWNTGVEFFQDQANTFCRNSFFWSALKSLVGPPFLLLAPSYVLWKG